MTRTIRLLLPLWAWLIPVILWGQPQAYFFTMSGCAPCKQMEPEIDLLISKGYPITKIDAALQPQWSQRFGVTSTPTVVIVVNDQIVRKQSGILDAGTIASWINSQSASLTAANDSANATAATSRTDPNALGGSGMPQSDRIADDSTGDTVHQGTRVPAGEIETAAMQATVRIRVEDAEGFSFATGTVIHSYQGESLVLTCGHVFRENQGRGKISAEVNWLGDSPKRVSGELISYDSDANDVALIAIYPGFDIPPARLAEEEFTVAAGDEVFSIGCDLGEPPTIRRTQIKNQATYDGAKKYDIVGRPVVGRSGGGLFTPSGYLIGVCNAAAVHEDEGVYSSINNIYHEIGRAGLVHVFRGATQQLASPPPPSPELLALAAEVRGDVVTGSRANDSPAPRFDAEQLLAGNRSAPPVGITPVGYARPDSPLPPLDTGNSSHPVEMEAIVVLRSKSNHLETRTIVVDRLPPELLSQLEKAGSIGNLEPAPNKPQPTLNDMARLRREMPELMAEQKNDERGTLRAQSWK